MVKAEFASAPLVGDLLIWTTGEAELSTVRLRDDRMVTKHYDLTSAGDLTVLLEEFVTLARDGTVPPAAMVGTYP